MSHAAPEDSVDVELSPARIRFGRYELVGELASGGMASVHLARLVGESGVARVVAIKRIHPHLARDVSFGEMFLDEARIASRIDHPNVCHVLEYGKEGGVAFLAMEFLAGEPLHRVIQRLSTHPEILEDRRAPYVLASIVAEACDGLHAAHELTDERGAPLYVVHRDVSPHNLFVTFDGAVKVVDFGIATAANKAHHTETGTVKGKFAYMPPEQLAGEKADRRFDVWALGVVLWEALTGERLFRRESPSEVVRAVETGPIPLPSMVRAGVPTAFDPIVLRAVCRSVEERTPTAKELARELRAVVRASGEHVDRAMIAEWMERLFPDGPERRRRWIAAAAAPAEDEEQASAPRERISLPTVPEKRAGSLASAERSGVERVGSSQLSSAAPAPEASGSADAGGARRTAVYGTIALSIAVALFTVWQFAAPAPSPDLARPAAREAVPAPAPPVEPSMPIAVVGPENPASEDSTAGAAPSEYGAPEAGAARGTAPGAPAGGTTPRHHREPTVEERAVDLVDEDRVVPETPPPTDVRPACLTLGGSVAATIDGERYEGPRSACVHLRAGTHHVSVGRLADGDPLWSEDVELAPGERGAITPTGLRRTP